MTEHKVWVQAVLAGSGAALVMALLALLQQWQQLWLVAPFGATAVILFALPGSPLGKAKNVIAGHFLAALIGLTFVHGFGLTVWSLSMAVGLAIGVMVLLKITHPPAGATTLLIMLTAPDWWFLLNPVLTGSVLMLLVAHYYHKSHRKGHQHLLKRRAAAARTKVAD
ncbi:HPP family protein [Rheinheimera mesophila]|nr:HPP family protein [Rheinheimera mesophila]